VPDTRKAKWSRPTVRDFADLDQALAYYSARLSPEDFEKLESFFRTGNLVRQKRSANG
jgi:hypothetical protein